MGTNSIYQYSLVNALMSGVTSSGIRASSLLTRGNQGLGTFPHLNGEAIILDNAVYQLSADADVHRVSDDQEMPYAVITDFSAQKTVSQTLASKEDIDRVLEAEMPETQNLFLSYRIEGRFKSLEVRMVRGKQGESLSQSGDTQKVDTYTDVEGTIIGFRTPGAWQGFFVAGEHMHFVDKERKAGGHVLELEGGDVEVKIAVCKDLHIELPTNDEFKRAEMKTDDVGLKKVEG